MWSVCGGVSGVDVEENRTKQPHVISHDSSWLLGHWREQINGGDLL